MKSSDPFIRFELNGRTWTYTGTPNADELSEAPWWTPQLEAVVGRWFDSDQTEEDQRRITELLGLHADGYFKRLIEAAGGRIVEVRSKRADGSVHWDDLPDGYVR